MPQYEHKTGYPHFLLLPSDSLLTWLSQNENVIRMSGNILLKDKILLHNTTQLHVSEGSGCDRKISVTKLCFFLGPLWLFLLYSTTQHIDCPDSSLSLHITAKLTLFLRQNSSHDSLPQQEMQSSNPNLIGLLVSQTWLHSTCWFYYFKLQQ